MENGITGSVQQNIVSRNFGRYLRGNNKGCPQHTRFRVARFLLKNFEHCTLLSIVGLFVLFEVHSAK